MLDGSSRRVAYALRGVALYISFLISHFYSSFFFREQPAKFKFYRYSRFIADRGIGNWTREKVNQRTISVLQVAFVSSLFDEGWSLLGVGHESRDLESVTVLRDRIQKWIIYLIWYNAKTAKSSWTNVSDLASASTH